MHADPLAPVLLTLFAAKIGADLGELLMGIAIGNLGLGRKVTAR